MTATILVVEDDRLIRDLVSKALHRDGHQALGARWSHRTGIVQTLRSVISDFVMPKLDAGSLVSAQNPYNFDDRLSNLLSSTIKFDAMAEVPAKPVEFDALRSIVRCLLNSTPHATTS